MRFLNFIHMALRCSHLSNTDFFLVDESDYHGRLQAKIGGQRKCEVVAACHVVDVSAQPGAQTRTELVAERNEAEENRYIPGAKKSPVNAEVRGTVAIQERPIIMGVAQTVKSFLKKMNRTKPRPLKA